MSVPSPNNSQPVGPAPLSSSTSTQGNHHSYSSNTSSLVSTFNAVTQLVGKIRGDAALHQAASAQADEKANKARGHGDVLLSVAQGLMKLGRTFGLVTDENSADTQAGTNAGSEPSQQYNDQVTERTDNSQELFSDARDQIKKSREEMDEHWNSIDSANTYEVYAEGLQNKIKTATNNNTNIGGTGQEQNPELPNASPSTDRNIVSNPLNNDDHL